MSTATSGRAREYLVRDEMIVAGWTFVMRSAGSKGPADIAMAHPEHGLALVQIGTASKALSPSARAMLCHVANLCGALPILATRHKGETSYKLVTNDRPSTWEDWTP